MSARLVTLTASLLLTGMVTAAWPSGIRFYIGTYTRQGSEGIYTTVLDPATGALSAPVLAGKAQNPSFVAVHPNKRFLYAVGEGARPNTSGEKGAVAFSIDPRSGKLTELNQRDVGGRGPCHLIVDPAGTRLIVANYSSGSVAVFPVGADGRLGARSQLIQHEGSGPNEKRQKGPHAHGVTLDATGRYAFICDLGIDKVMVYRLSTDNATLSPAVPPSASTPPGGGPRHAAFAPDGRHLFVINELDSTVTTYRWDATAGALEQLGTVSTLPLDFEGRNTTAEIAVHPSGRFVYGSNRGHDSIAVFTRDADSGKLERVQLQPCGGKTPRCFTLDPSGRFLLVANQASNNIVVYRINTGTGRLTPTGNEISVSMPVCVAPYVP
jgi:6-phosphogluconolactonase